jgi:serine/threonine-protein kinase
VCPDVSPLFDAPLLRMLEKNPALRPAGAGEAVAALRRAAQEAGIEMAAGPLRLSRPAPSVSGERPKEELEPFLEDFADTEPVQASITSRDPAPRPLWPFALGLLLLGVALAFAVLRSPSASSKPEPQPSVAASAGPVASPPALIAVKSSEPLPSAVPAPSASVPSAPALPAVPEKRPKPRAGNPTQIPTDLENPFR